MVPWSVTFCLFLALWFCFNSGKMKRKLICTKRVAPEFSPFHFFHFSLYQHGTKWVCTVRDVPGTKTSGRNGQMWKGENSGVTRFLQSVVNVWKIRGKSKIRGCLLLIDKTRVKDKTYIWVSVWWTFLTYTGLLVELEHLKVETTLIDDMLVIVMGEYVFLKLSPLFIMNRWNES